MAKKRSKSSHPATKHIGSKVWDELKAPLFIVAGVAGGTLAGKLIDKVIPANPTAPGFQPKAFIKPAVLVAAGIGGRFLAKNENLKLIATGITITGVLSGTKAILKKDILQGLAEVSGLGAAEPARQVFREPMNLAIEPYNPDLPRLPQAQMAAPGDMDTEITGPEDTEITGTDDNELLGDSEDKDIAFA